MLEDFNEAFTEEKYKVFKPIGEANFRKPFAEFIRNLVLKRIILFIKIFPIFTLICWAILFGMYRLWVLSPQIADYALFIDFIFYSELSGFLIVAYVTISLLIFASCCNETFDVDTDKFFSKIFHRYQQFLEGVKYSIAKIYIPNAIIQKLLNLSNTHFNQNMLFSGSRAGFKFTIHVGSASGHAFGNNVWGYFLRIPIEKLNLPNLVITNSKNKKPVFMPGKFEYEFSHKDSKKTYKIYSLLPSKQLKIFNSKLCDAIADMGVNAKYNSNICYIESGVMYLYTACINKPFSLDSSERAFLMSIERLQNFIRNVYKFLDILFESANSSEHEDSDIIQAISKESKRKNIDFSLAKNVESVRKAFYEIIRTKIIPDIQKQKKEFYAQVAIKRLIISEIIKLFGDLNWSASYSMSHSELSSLPVLPYAPVVSSNDYFSGIHNGTYFEVFNPIFEKDPQNEIVTEFVIIKLKANKPFKGYTLISDDSKFLFTPDPSLRKTELEDVVFEKKYDVWTSDEIEARYLITTSFIKRLNGIRNVFLADKVNCVFRDDFVYFIFNKENAFEVYNPARPVTEFSQYTILLEQVLAVYQLMDKLKLDQKIHL